MAIRSSSLVVLAALAGCATAGPQQLGAGTDAPSGAKDAHGPDSPDGSSSVSPDGGSSGCAYSGVLATWNLSGEPGSQASTAAASSAPGVTAGSISRATGLTTSTGSGSINSSNWPTTAQLDPTKYYTLAITPPAGCSLSLTSMSLDTKASGTGPASAAAATSADGFTQTANVAPSAASSPSLSVSSTTAAVEVRIYGYGAGGGTGTMRVQNVLTLDGTIQ